MEQVQKARVTVAAPISSRTLVVALLIFFSVLFGVLNFVVPTHYLIAVVIIAVSAILLFMYPFIGLLVYQLIMVIQPAAIFPALEALRPERVMAIFLIISLIINIKLRHEKLIVLEHKLVYFMIFFILAMVVSIPTSYWPTQSIEHLIDFLKTFAYVLLIINIVKTPLRLKIFLWEYLLLMGYMAVSSAIAYKTGNVQEAQGIIRAQGLANIDPNSLAISIGMALPFHFLLFRIEKRFLLKILSLLLVAATIYTMILTGSRGGMVGLAIITLACWWILPQRLIRLFVLLMCAFMLVAVMPAQYQTRYASIFSGQRDASSMERINVWNKGIRMFLDRPFTGVGTGAFGTANAEGYSEGRRSYLKAHNLYVQLAAELGIIGLVAFGVYVAGMLIYQSRYRRFIVERFQNKDWLWGCLMALTVSICTLLVVGMFGHNLYRSNWYFYGGLTVSIGYIMGGHLAKENAKALHGT